MLDFYKINKVMVARMIDLFVGLAEIMLALRVVMSFFFTTAGGGFVSWVFSTTDVLLAPFRAVFPHATVAPGNWYIDWPALFAMALYMAAGYLAYNIAMLWSPSGRK